VVILDSVLLSVTTTHRPATDLGFLLHKNPDRAQRFDLAAGVAHVLYPQADEQRCTAVLLLEVDPVGLVRGARGPALEGFSLGQYVNDRPYAASSLLAVALGKVFGSAMRGRCDARQELARTRSRWRSTFRRCPAAVVPGWPNGCSDPLAGRSRPGRLRWIRPSPSGARAAMRQCG
jgi:hypothetical protein